MKYYLTYRQKRKKKTKQKNTAKQTMTLNMKLLNMFYIFTETISEPSVFYCKEAKERFEWLEIFLLFSCLLILFHLLFKELWSMRP